MKNIFIINPASGKDENKETLKEQIREACDKIGEEFEIYVTKKPLDSIDYIKDVCKKNIENEKIRIFACGGDGTFCEVVNGILAAENNENVSVGVLPVGTGNDFIKSFDSRDAFLDIELQLNATEKEIDVILCNDIYAANMINIGFDSEVVVKTSKIKKKSWVPSKLAYIFGLILTALKKPTLKIKSLKIDYEEKILDAELLLTTFANGRFCGGGFNSNPYALMDDGKIDVMLIQNISIFKFLMLVGSYKSGTHINEKNALIINNLKAERIEMEFSKPTNVCIDGEIKEFGRVVLEVKHKALSVLVPCDRKENCNVGNEAACSL